ncbi:hypothetical protein ACYCFK_09190 [Stutzerimonas stutzeri]
MKQHPIQLLNVFVDELRAVVLDRNSFAEKEYPKTFNYKVFSTNFDEENSTIAIKVEFSIQPPEDAEVADRPFSMKIVVTAAFSVDTELFPADLLEHWSFNNAPVVLIPFIRENAYALSSRIGFEPVLIPMIEVPTVKIVAKD